MNPEQITLVENSYAKIRPIAATADVREAWTEAYTFLTDVMIDASHEAASNWDMVTCQANLLALDGHLNRLQQQIDSTNQLVKEIHQPQTLLQQTGVLPQDGYRSRMSLLRRFWQWGNRPLLR